MRYADVILSLVPTAQFAISENDYSSLQWFGPGDAPTEAAIIAAGSAVELAVAKRDRIALMRSSCETRIQAGFTSNALGSNHAYPTTYESDRANIALANIESLNTSVLQPLKTFDLWNYDGSTWDRRSHTHTQTRTVCNAMSTHIRGHQDTLRGRISTINACTTVEQVNAVTW